MTAAQPEGDTVHEHDTVHEDTTLHERDERPEPSGDTGARGKRAVFRVPGIALVGALMLFMCMFPLAGTVLVPYLIVLLIVPLVVAVWIVRSRTVAAEDGLTVTTLVGKRTLPWDSLKGINITPKRKVVAVLADDTKVALPSVRPRHLPVLSLVSDGRIPDPSGLLDEPEASGEPGDETAETTEATEAADVTETTEATEGSDAADATDTTAPAGATEETGAAETGARDGSSGDS